MPNLTTFQPELIGVAQLAQLIHKSSASVRSDASRNPSALPPICRLPGNRRLLWRLEDVAAWLEKCVDRSPHGVSPASEMAPVEPRRRGRPRKTEVRQ
jgi:hypothetical protein